MIRPAPLLALALAACASTPARTRWTGPVTPTRPGPLCTPSRGLLDIAGTAVTFEPNEGTWILRGDRAADGTINAGQITTGADKKPYETTLVARQTPTGIDGTYTTPRCTYTVALKPR